MNIKWTRSISILRSEIEIEIWGLLGHCPEWNENTLIVRYALLRK